MPCRSPQLKVLAQIATTYARGTADITDRQNIQYHWIRIEDVPAIWDLLDSVGLQTTEACGDTPRVVLGSPVAGIAADEIIDGTPAIKEIVERWIGDPELANLPRKFKTAVSGSPHQDIAHEVQDVAFVGIDHPEYGPGFDVWVGGGLSTNPMLGQSLGAFVPLEDVAEVWYGVIRIFRDYGYRRLRNRARLKFLVADWGPEKFRQILEDEYLGRKMQDGVPLPPAPSQRRDHVGVHRQRDGRYYVGAAPVVGRVGGDILVKLAEAVEASGSKRIRLTPHQKLVVLDVPSVKVPDLVDALDALGPGHQGLGVPPRNDGLHRHRVLQAGDRRDQGDRGQPDRRTRGAVQRRAGAVRAGLTRAEHQPERLPERLRQNADRRHRPQGHSTAEP